MQLGYRYREITDTEKTQNSYWIWIMIVNSQKGPWALIQQARSVRHDSHIELVLCSHNRVIYLDSKVHGANMGPIWGRQDPGGPHDGPMNFAIWVAIPSAEKWIVFSKTVRIFTPKTEQKFAKFAFFLKNMFSPPLMGGNAWVSEFCTTCILWTQ